MDEIEKELRSGVRKIITRFTPQSLRGECGLFQSSSHPNREFVFALSGSSRYMFNDSVYDFEPGTIFLIDHWIPHAFGYRKIDHDLLHLWGELLPDETLAARILHVGMNGCYRLHMRRLHFPAGLAEWLIRRWDSLSRLEAPGDDAVRRSLLAPFNAMLDETAFQLFPLPGTARQHSGGNADAVVEQLKNYIRTRIGRDCSLEHLEQISGYSRFHLAHRFRQTTGGTVKTYINTVRIEYTRAALKRGLPRKEIARELGFSSPSNFWSWFDRYRKCFEES